MQDVKRHWRDQDGCIFWQNTFDTPPGLVIAQPPAVELELTEEEEEMAARADFYDGFVEHLADEGLATFIAEIV